MHETSLAQSLLRQVCDIQQEYPLSRILEVEVELGPLSGVEPILLSMAFARLVAEQGLDNVELILNQVALQAICDMCHQLNVIQDFVFVCSHCQSTKLKIIQGDCVKLMSVNLAPTDVCEGSGL